MKAFDWMLRGLTQLNIGCALALLIWLACQWAGGGMR